MIGLHRKLEQLENAGTPIMVGVVGAGQMGRGLVSQISMMKGMRPAVMADRTPDKVKRAFNNAGYVEGRDFETAETIAQADKIIRSGKLVATSNTELAVKCAAVQCVVDATGNPESGAVIAAKAIENKKHIVMLNVEADVCVGHILYKRAADAGVVYTGAAGDEPAAIIELYDFAAALGFDVRVLGKGKNNAIQFDCTPDSVSEEAYRRGINPRMLCAFKDGTNTMIEMAAVANATGFLPDIPGMHGVAGTVEMLPELLSLTSEGRGGVLSSYKTLEYTSGVAPGVFAIVSADKPDIIHQMEYLFMGGGPNYILFRPYHLCSIETPISVARAVLYNEPTIVPYAGHIAEVVTVAKADLTCGDVPDGIGGNAVRGLLISAADAGAKNALPIGLVTKNIRICRDVKKGDIITYDDVFPDENSFVWKLRREQDLMYV